MKDFLFFNSLLTRKRFVSSFSFFFPPKKINHLQKLPPLFLLPHDLLFKILLYCDPYSLGNTACVSKYLLETIQNVELWKKACLEAWPLSGSAKVKQLVTRHYNGNWKTLWLTRPRLRCDGIYVSRNTYIKTVSKKSRKKREEGGKRYATSGESFSTTNHDSSSTVSSCFRVL